ncbi:MAG: hypothetical protein COS89_03765 [Deltaproteobacteria bacterium CG07_land_8_20_14_0_80_38_7]|nr:MAG: hypothetical protein COS89_03765 [Deltaproteobacteria bacterium CG07_land_8_20_14_0_80_38_7]
MFEQRIILFIVFNIVVFGMLFIDLKVVHRKSHVVSMKEAAIWSVVWTAVAMVFNAYVWYDLGQQKGLDFFTSYFIERALSVDNLFVFVIIFKYFSVPPLYHHKILYWGILGAVIMRAIFILSGIAMITKFYFVMYIFGAFLVITGIKMLFIGDKEIHPERNIVLKILRRFIPITNSYSSGKFFTKENGKMVATVLFVVLIVVETTDVVFAIDSIPAVFGITTDVLIVYTSNIFAILGLRVLYFLLSNMMDRFCYLGIGVALVLTIIGIKMLLIDFVHISTLTSLGLITLFIGGSIVISLIKTKKVES